MLNGRGSDGRGRPMLMLMDLRQQCSISASLSALARSLVEAGGEEPQAQSKVCGVGRILCRFCGCAEREGKANVPVMCWCTTLDLLLFLLSPAASEPIASYAHMIEEA